MRRIFQGPDSDFTFPQMQDLRLDMWDECEGRDVGLNESTAGGQAPTVGGCVGDGSSTFDLISNDDGSLTLELSPNGYREDWPMGEDLFFDFTTEPIPEPAPPVWTEESPSNGTWFPVPESGDVSWASWDDGVSRWFYDEDGVKFRNIMCGEQNLNFRESPDRALDGYCSGFRNNRSYLCQRRDGDGETTENRTWYISEFHSSVYSDSDIR